MDTLSSGATGLVVGALLGLLLAVFLEDYLKDQTKRLGSWTRRVRSRGRLPERTDEFQLGPLRTPMLVVEGDGEQVINEQSIRIVIDPVDVELPDEMAAWRAEVAREQQARRDRGEQFFWNGPNYAVTGLVVSRTTVNEAPEACLRLKHADYYTFMATQQLDREFADGTTPRARYLSSGPATAPDFMCCSFGTNVALVTADNLLAVQRRSDQVGSQPGTWSSSANEALSRELDSRGRTASDLYDVMRRGIAEELAVDQSEYHLEMLAFTIDTHRQQWGALFTAELHDLTAADLQARRTRGVPDKWEHQHLEFVAFEVEPVITYLLRPDRVDNWSSVGPVVFYLALIRRFGRARVERATARLLRSPGRDDRI
ncbi:hypothetical protein [Actinocrispum wychmicini]|uniref:hypothetical protein n=1 Tax=Actinocrispum wychmicini TaxID=1213861 RepID=UPI001A9CC191|nr:hypothetical protein [Actinocrispum wychmicini]